MPIEYVADGIELDPDFRRPETDVYTLTSANNWTLPSNIRVPSADEAGYPYQYFFDEVAARNVPGGNTVTYEMDGDQRKRITIYNTDKKDTITNNLPDSIELDVKKRWNENAEIAPDAYIDVIIKRYKLVNDETVTEKYGYLDIVHQFTGALTEMPEGFTATYVVKDSGNNVVSDITTTGRHRLRTGTYTVTETITNQGNHNGTNVTESGRTVTVTIPEEETDTAIFSTIYTKKQAHVQVIHYAYSDEWQKIDGYFDQDSDISVVVHRPDYAECHIYSRIGNHDADATELPFTPSGGFLVGGTNRSYTFHVPVVDEYVIYITHDNTSADEIWPVSISQMSTDTLNTLNAVNGTLNSALSRGTRLLAKGSSAILAAGLTGTDGYTAINGDTTLTNIEQAPSTDVPGKKYVVDADWSYTTTLRGNAWEKKITQDDMASAQYIGQYLAAKDSDGYDYLYFIDSATEYNMLPGTEGKIDLNGDNVLTSTGESPLTLSNIGPVKHYKDLEIDKAWINGERTAISAEVADYAVTFEVLQKEIDTQPASFVVVDDGQRDGWNSIGTYKVKSTTNGEKLTGDFSAVFEAWKATVKDLPENMIYATSSNNKYYQYKVVEVKVEKNGTDVTSEFVNPVSNVTGAQAIITNDLQKGALEITKHVLFNNALATEERQKTLLNGDYLFTVKDSEGISIDGSPFTVSVSNGIAQSLLIPDLKSGNYTVEETNSNGLVLKEATGGVTVSNNVVTVTVTAGKTTSAALLSSAKADFTNNLPVTDVNVQKTWMDGTMDYSGSLSTMFGNVEVDVEVVKVAESASEEDVSTASVAKNIFGEDAKGTISSPVWNVTIGNLPLPESGYTYAVREIRVRNGETDISEYFTKTGEGIVSNGHITINNKPETTEVVVFKEWKPIIPDNTDVTFSLYKGKDVTSASTKVADIVLDGKIDPTTVQINSSDITAGTKKEDAPWQATFAKLPKYAYNSTDGIYPITYVVNEGTVPRGYTVVYRGNQQYALTGETITNTRLPGNLELKKTVSGEGADPDQEFEFTVSLTAPDGITFAENYSFKKGEEAAEGITYSKPENNTKATVSGITLKHGEMFTIVGLPAGTLYEVTETDYSSLGFSTSTSTNSGDPVSGRTVNGSIIGGTTEKESVTYTNYFQADMDINILKVDKSDESPLTGAKFKLLQYDEGYHQVTKEWAEREVCKDSGKEGTLTFDELHIGYYELVETESPAGYIKTSSNPRFEVKADPNGGLVVVFSNTDMVLYDSNNKTFTVKNTPGAALPNTGGPGTNLLYLIGLMLTAFGSGGLMMKKRRRKAA